jgi:KDO2-lipid IV(A) lauroyltransferase
MRRRPPSLHVRIAQRAAAAAAALTGAAVGRLPPPAARRLGAGLGAVAYRLLPGRRQVVLANLALVLGDGLSAGQRAALARECFRHLGITAVECCRLFFGCPETLLARVRVQGLEHLRAAVALGRGVFYLTAHFGNWELLAAAHRLTGLPLSVVVRPLDNPYLESVLARARERSGLRVVPKRQAIPGVRAAIRRGESVGILLDQDAGRAGAFVPFLGQLASTSRSLAILALKTRAPVIPAFIRRLPDSAHELVLESPVPVAVTGDLEHDIRENTARFAAAIERHVRAHPEQWFWVHRRWKTRPA